jgi:all-trans-8'-apo-beta-carotenal 15,15'-oxygenase
MKNANSRRHFLKSSTQCAGAVVASNLGAMWLSQIAGATTISSSPTDFKVQFARALKNDSSLTPFAGVSADLSCDSLIIEGKLPPNLKGRFYRNGPALFERGDQRYQHWFAGDGMVQQFNFDGNSISHRGRFVQTSKFTKEESAGRFLLPAFGSDKTQRAHYRPR